MQERVWTDEQKLAIDTRDRSLLVSAAAGSGKTATLTERIIRSLTDEENPVDIDSLLVVTFTKAAASELSAKLTKALTDAVMKNPENKRLQRQLFMLPAAKIRTIDSFCGEILRSSADRVGVPPNYRIADVAETELLASTIADGLIESVFRGELPEIATPEELDRLSDCLTDSGRSDELSEAFRYLRSCCDTAVDGVGSLEKLVGLYDPEKYTSFEKTPFGEYIIKRVHEAAKHYFDSLERIEESLLVGDKKELPYADSAALDMNILRSLIRAETYTDMRAVISTFELERLPTVRGEKSTAANDYRLMRPLIKKDITSFSTYFLYTDEEIGELFSELYKTLTPLVRFIRRFDNAFLEEKRRRGALSYADVEHYAYKCLVKDGEPTDIALNLRRAFSAIYIDEYQDVNAIQNAIFDAIAREDNRFMVGDIKQSIYGFREARPDIFSKMKESFPSISESKPGGAAAIFMSQNFRCDKGIVDFVNSVFDGAFHFLGESIGYTEGDRLGYAKIHKPFPEPPYREPEIYMLGKKPPKHTDPEEEIEEEDLDAPATVAEEIKKLLNSGTLNSGEPIKPSDIAIIMRSAKGRDVLYAEALASRGIPVKISGAKEFFLSSEVLLALSLLNSIDNPRRDIYLAAAMCSPLFGFTPDDLYRIKRGRDKDEILYTSLLSYSQEHPEDERVESFLSKLAYYREISEGIGADALIYKLYRETGLLSLASRSGGRDNLLLLYDYARGYEAGGYRGLYSFISFINSVIDKKTSFDQRRDTDSEDAVSIVTAHYSKGLEYPVVFFVDAGARYSNSDTRKRLAYSEGFGIALWLRTPSGLAIVNNPVHSVINHYVFRKEYEEELRILYVALTRAREQLFVVGTAPTIKRDEYLERIELLRRYPSEYCARTLLSNLEVILVFSGKKALLPNTVTDTAEEKTDKEEQKEISATEGFYESLLSRFSFEYPDPTETDMPEKLSVSRATPTVLDGTEGVYISFEEESEGRAKLPSFLSGKSGEESAKRGIATHLVLQFCDLSLLEKEGAEAELTRLLRGGFISSEDAGRVRLPEISLFAKSELFHDMCTAKRLWRELRFNAELPASLFTEEEEKKALVAEKKVLLQGVIDCIIEYPDGSIGVFDYKTDRLTKEELSDRALAEEKLRASHTRQLSLYALAVEKMLGKKPSRVAVYSLPLGDTVEIEDRIEI